MRHIKTNIIEQMKHIKANVIEQMKHFTNDYSEGDVILSSLGITKHFLALFQNSRSPIFSYLFLKENISLINLEYLLECNTKLYQIVIDYKNECFEYSHYIDKIFKEFFSMEFTITSKTKYKKSLVEQMRKYASEKTTFKFIKETPFTNTEKVLFSIITFKLLNDKTINNFYYLREFVILFLVKFQIDYSDYFLDCYDYENDECLKQSLIIINSLEDYTYSISQIEEKEVAIILEYLKNINKFNEFKDDFDFQRRICNLQLNIFSKLDYELSFSFIEEECPPNVFIALISKFELYESSSNYLKHYLEAYGSMYDTYEYNMQELLDVIRNDSFNIETLKTVAKIFKTPQIVADVITIIDNLSIFIEKSSVEDTLFLDISAEEGHYNLFKTYIDSKMIRSKLVELFGEIDNDEDIPFVEDTVLDMMTLYDHLYNLFYANSPYIFNTFSIEQFSNYCIQLNKEKQEKQEKDNKDSFYEETNIAYDYYMFKKNMLKDVVINRLCEMSKSSFYKHNISYIDRDSIDHSIEDMNQDDHNWLDLLCQAEFLIGFYHKIDSHNFKNNDIDWTFIYVLLVKTAEFLIGNFVEKMLKKYHANQDEFNYDYNKMDKKINLKSISWRKYLTMKNYQFLIKNYIVDCAKNNYDITSFIKQMNHLIVYDRNRYIHSDLITNFNELHVNLKDNIYLTIYRIIEIYVHDLTN